MAEAQAFIQEAGGAEDEQLAGAVEAEVQSINNGFVQPDLLAYLIQKSYMNNELQVVQEGCEESKGEDAEEPEVYGESDSANQHASQHNLVPSN